MKHKDGGGPLWHGLMLAPIFILLLLYFKFMLPQLRKGCKMKSLNIFWIGCVVVVVGGAFLDYGLVVSGICSICAGVITMVVAASVADNQNVQRGKNEKIKHNVLGWYWYYYSRRDI